MFSICQISYHLQQASGIFNYLKDVILSHVQNDPTPDMHPDTLGALGALMLAQAQDCFCRKAMNGKRLTYTQSVTFEGSGNFTPLLEMSV